MLCLLAKQGTVPNTHAHAVNHSCFSDLMREPVLQDKSQEHLRFCKYARVLIEVVSGKPQNVSTDGSLEKIRKVRPASNRVSDRIVPGEGGQGQGRHFAIKQTGTGVLCVGVVDSFGTEPKARHAESRVPFPMPVTGRHRGADAHRLSGEGAAAADPRAPVGARPESGSGGAAAGGGVAQVLDAAAELAVLPAYLLTSRIESCESYTNTHRHAHNSENLHMQLNRNIRTHQILPIVKQEKLQNSTGNGAINFIQVEEMLHLNCFSLQGRQPVSASASSSQTSLAQSSPGGGAATPGGTSAVAPRPIPASPGTPLGPIRVNIVNNRTASPQTNPRVS